MTTGVFRRDAARHVGVLWESFERKFRLQERLDFGGVQLVGRVGYPVEEIRGGKRGGCPGGESASRRTRPASGPPCTREHRGHYDEKVVGAGDRLAYQVGKPWRAVHHRQNRTRANRLSCGSSLSSPVGAQGRIADEMSAGRTTGCIASTVSVEVEPFRSSCRPADCGARPKW